MINLFEPFHAATNQTFPYTFRLKFNCTNIFAMVSGFLNLYEPLLEGKALYQATPVDKKATQSFQKLSLHHQSCSTWQALKFKSLPQTAALS